MKTLVGVFLALGVVACGDSSGPGPQAASVTGVAGDNQSAARGAALPFALSFTALGSNGQPIQGVPVSWSVTPAGGATFSAQTSQTDVNGVASTTVTLGSTLGAITLQATVAGVSPLVYHATVLDPCTILTAHAVGDSVNAALATIDCLLQNQFGEGWYFDFYGLVLSPGQKSFRINMRSATFGDTFLELYDTAGLVVAFDDDSILAVETNSQLDIILPGVGNIIAARSFETFTTGSYSLATTARPGGMNGCRQVWITSGVSVTESITAADCNDGTVPSHFDVARIWLRDGDTLTVAQRSATVNAKLTLYELVNGPPVNGNYPRTLLVSNDDSAAGNLNAFITYIVPVAKEGPYDIVIGTSTAGETGAYTFEVSASPSLSPRRASATAGPGSWWRDVALPKRSKR